MCYFDAQLLFAVFSSTILLKLLLQYMIITYSSTTHAIQCIGQPLIHSWPTIGGCNYASTGIGFVTFALSLGLCFFIFLNFNNKFWIFIQDNPSVQSTVINGLLQIGDLASILRREETGVPGENPRSQVEIDWNSIHMQHCSRGGRCDWCPLRQPDFPRSTAHGILSRWPPIQISTPSNRAYR